MEQPVGTLSKRMRTRLRSRRSRNDRSIRVSTDPTEGGSQSLMKVAEWIPFLDGMRPTILPKSGADALDISGFTQEELRTSISHYEDFMEIPRGLATINQVVHSSAGVRGWLDHDPDHLMRVGQEVHSPGLCGLWLRQALSAVADLPEWERLVLTVNSGASVTVIPPHVASFLPLLHSSQVGTEYEVGKECSHPHDINGFP